MACISGKHCEESDGKAALDCPRGSYCEDGIVSFFVLIYVLASLFRFFIL